MASFASTERLARASARRPWAVVGVWVVLFLLGGFLAAGIGDVLSTEQDFITEPEAVRAERLLEERLRGPQKAQEFIIVRSPDRTVDDPQFKAFVDRLLADVRGLTGVTAGATSFYETGLPDLVSPDRHTTLIPVTIAGKLTDAPETVVPLVDLVHEANGRNGFEVLTGGDGSIGKTFNEAAEKDLQQAEVFGLPVALVVLLVVFGAAVAAGVPIVLALLAIVVAVGLTALVGRAFDLSFFVINMITMIGLAVGIDYSLFVVERFREERRHGLSVVDAIGRAGATSSRAVLFSGFTVIVALLGMLIVPTTIFRSLAIGAVIVVIVAVAAALTLLPAVLRLLGDRVNALRIPLVRRRTSAGEDGGFWSRAARLVMAHPWVSVLASGAILIAAALPYFTIELGSSGVSSLPEESEAARSFAILQEEFSLGLLAPINIVVDAPNVNGPEIEAGIVRLRDRLAADPRFGPSKVETNQAGDLALVSVPVNAETSSDTALGAVKSLRNEYVPQSFQGVDAEVLVGGMSAQNQDFFDLVDRYTPIVFTFVLALSFVLLLVAFRSLVVPVKAIIMNLLSVGAAYGLLVLVFQHGWGSGLFGFQRTPTIEAWIPLFMFTVLFGLSMDYHVFLLSRIRERFDQTRDNAGAVAFGLRSTAGIITGAALIMVIVFGAFATGQLVMMQQVGFGLAVAVILDATIVRIVLVPASMELLGARNWYLPAWLSWLPNVGIEGDPGDTHEPHKEAAPVGAPAVTGGD